MSASTPPHGSVASWIELSERALADNLAALRAMGAGAAPAPKLGVVLKANAYGHGLAPMLSLVHHRADILYFITAADALTVRRLETERGWEARRVLVMGPVTAEEALALARADVETVIADTSWSDVAAALRRAGLERRLRAHLHIDTGLGREGFAPAQLERGEVSFLSQHRDVIEVIGALSHFANTEDVTEQAYALAQLDEFEAGLRALAATLSIPDTLERHIAASAAALVLPASRYDAIRAGIATFGFWPSAQTRLSTRLVSGTLPRLTPVLAWRCPSQTVKWLAAGSFVGYGCTYRCSEPTRVAVLPVGYYDGYPRLASNRAHVLVNGRRCPVLGRVMMNHLVVDVTHATADERPVIATLIGQDGDEAVTAESLADWAQTIHYEIVARLASHVPRVIVA